MGIAESPILEKYEYDDHDGHMPDPPDEELDVTPAVGHNYFNTSVMLPRGDHMARGKVIRRKLMPREIPLDEPKTIQFWTPVNTRFSLQIVK